ncbi:hypothetical protein HGRIS_011018 [Hohenbuehelia grisea]|uniref:G domain-containing protein n=1 Tax=Hohenbuehelia grisea TaxID=104357 RepID=A0ABR3IZC6_9AGAR
MPIAPQKVFVAVIGTVGSGRTTFIARASKGDKIPKTSILGIQTLEIGGFECIGPGSITVTLIDTPGFDNPSKSDDEILRNLRQWVMDRGGAKLSGTLLLHSVGGNPIPKNLPERLKAMCKDEFYGKVTIVAWEAAKPMHQTEQPEHLYQEAISNKHGAQVERFEDNYDSAWSIISSTVERGANPEPALLDHSSRAFSLRKMVRDFIKMVRSMMSGESQLPLSQEVIIALMGPSGSGKSSFINAVTGRADQEVGDGLAACTTEVKFVAIPPISELPDVNIVLVDTPGLDDTDNSGRILEITSKVKATYGKDARLSGILYFHRMSDSPPDVHRQQMHLAMFATLCGSDYRKKMVITTTMGDDVEGIRKENEDRFNHHLSTWDEASEVPVQSFTYTPDSGWRVLKDLVGSPKVDES